MRSSQFLSALGFIIALGPYRVEGAPTASQSHGLQGPASVVGNLSSNTPRVIPEENSAEESTHAQSKLLQNLAVKTVTHPKPSQWVKRTNNDEVNGHITGLSKLQGEREEILGDAFRHNDGIESGTLTGSGAAASAADLRSRISAFQEKADGQLTAAAGTQNGLSEPDASLGDAIEEGQWQRDLSDLTGIMGETGK